MKQLIFACLLGLGSLLPTNEVKSNAITSSRILDINISGWVLYATSQTENGVINKIEVYQASTMELVLIQTSCGGYSCSMDISDLASGYYIAKVHSTYGTYSEGFTW